MSWYIVSQRSGEGFQVKAQSDLDASSDYLVATHPDEASAIAGIERAQSLEKQMRPLWQAAIEHQMRVRNAMLDAVYAAAKPTEAQEEGVEDNGL